MKRQMVFCLILVLAVIPLFAQTDPFMPPNPTTMGMGGAYTANAEGYNSFFYNPAGFARKGEFTLMSTNVYGVLDKTLYNIIARELQGVITNNPPSVEQLLAKGATASRGGFDLSSLTALGINIDQTTLDTLASVGTDLGGYIQNVMAAPGGADAMATAFTNMAENPTVKAALESAGVSLDATSLGSLDQTALIGALLPALLANPEIVATLTDTFVSDLNAAVPSVTKPTSLNGLGASLQTALDQATTALTDLLPSGNANVGAMIGIAASGNGLGIGLFGNVAAGLYTPTGKSILSSMARASTTITLAAGLAFSLWDGFDIGFQVRPTINGYISFLPAGMITNLMSGSTDPTAIVASILSNGIYKGFRIGFDAGALWDLGDLTLGVAVKDLIPSPTLYLNYTDPMALLTPSEIANFKGATAIPGSYQVPGLKVNVGVQWHPDWGILNDILDPRIGVDVMDIGGWLRTSAADKAAAMSEWDILQKINIGAQVKLFKFLTFSAGLGQGMASAGVGINLLLVDINAAVGARYKANPKTFDDFSEVAFSVEVALLRIDEQPKKKVKATEEVNADSQAAVAVDASENTATDGTVSSDNTGDNANKTRAKELVQNSDSISN